MIKLIGVGREIARNTNIRAISRVQGTKKSIIKRRTT